MNPDRPDTPPPPQVQVRADAESVEAVTDLLARHGARNVALRTEATGDVVVRAELARNDAAARAAIEQGLWYLGRIGRVGALEDLAPEAAPARDPAHRVVVGARAIELVPGGAFGTGLHPATALCLAWLDELPVAGRRVLDAGAGTGVLAVLAAQRGAARVDAVELDAGAMGTLAANLARNGVADRVRARCGDAGDPALLAPDGYDLVLANLTAGVLADLAPALARAASPPDAALLLGGLLAPQEAQVAAAFARAGCAVRERRARGDWVALRLARG